MQYSIFLMRDSVWNSETLLVWKLWRACKNVGNLKEMYENWDQSRNTEQKNAGKNQKKENNNNNKTYSDLLW